MNTVVLSFGYGLVSAALIAIGAVGFTLQFGVSRIFNIAFGAIMTACAYIAYVVDIRLGTGVWVGMAAAAVSGAAISVVVERLLYSPLRRRGATVFTVIMASLAVDIIVQSAVLAIGGDGFFSYQLRPETALRLGELRFTPLQLTLMAIAAAVMIVTHAFLRYSRIGKAMRATAADPDLARSCGINSRLTTSVMWASSGLLCGIAGVSLGMNTAAVQSTTGDNFLLVIVAAAVVGGLGMPYGAMLGALGIGICTEEVSIINPTLQYVVAFGLLALMLVVRPGGLFNAGHRSRSDVMVISR